LGYRKKGRGSGAESKRNVELMKSGEEDGQFYRVKKVDEGQTVYIVGAPFLTPLIRAGEATCLITFAIKRIAWL
jgi:hypothetical protein